MNDTYDDDHSLPRLFRIQVAALMIACITAGAFVAIPIPISPVPIVLQNMFVVLAGIVLAPRWAAIAVLVYLGLGALGLPILAGARGGISHFAGPTGGFLLAYPLSAVLTSMIVRLGSKDREIPDTPNLQILCALLVGFLSVYVLGVPWLSFVVGLDGRSALAAGMIPFLPGDAVKLVLLFVLVKTSPRFVWQRLK